MKYLIKSINAFRKAHGWNIQLTTMKYVIEAFINKFSQDETEKMLPIISFKRRHRQQPLGNLHASKCCFITIN
jgi:hypothetical protein